MKTQVSPAVVGAFVLGAFTLGIMALLFFGGVSLFHQQQRFMVYFDESIQGLNLGSPVKLRGVAVGRVVSLNVRYDETKNQPLVAVVCEFDRNMITDNSGAVIDVSKSKQLESLINRGLRAQLGVIGLATGLLYVELDFLDPRENPMEAPIAGAKYPVMPAVPSAISEFQSSATEILTKLKRVDFEGLANDVKGLLTDAKVQIDSLDLKGLGAQWQRTGASVEALVKDPEIKQTFANLNATLASLRSALADLHETLQHVDTQVDGNGQELQATLRRTEQTLQQFDAAALTLRRFVGSQQNLGDDTHEALTHLAAAADAVERLADFLERNPNALLSGRAK
jgi:paraquat-inducible protein B